MTDQAAELRDLMHRRQHALLASHTHSQPEIWAFASGSQGAGLRTIALNVQAAVQGLGRACRVWNYRRAEFEQPETDFQPGEIVLALLAPRATASRIWNEAHRTLLVSLAHAQAMATTYACLQQLGRPERSPCVSLVFNRTTQRAEAEPLHRHFEQSSWQFLQTPTHLAGVIPAVVQEEAEAPFAVHTAAALAIRNMVSDFVHESQPVCLNNY